jgi:hypothetical protein
MMEQSNNEALLALSGRISGLMNRMDLAKQRVENHLRREEIMAGLLGKQITDAQAVELMEAADK